MHQVWRQRQGIPWAPEQPKGMLTNLAHVAKAQAMPNFEPAPADELTTAFGFNAYPKLVSCIAGSWKTGPEAQALRRKALEAALEMMKGPAHLAGLLAAGIVPALNTAITSEPDADIQAQALTVAARVARELTGRMAMYEHDSPRVLLRMTNHEAAVVRSACWSAITEVAKAADGITALVNGGCVKMLVDRSQTAPGGGPVVPAVQALVVTALGRICQRDTGLDEAIKEGAVPAAVGMLQADLKETRVQAAQCLAVLTHNQSEKDVALKAGVMPPLASMLQSGDPEMTPAAAAVLMSMSNGSNACKTEAVKAGCVSALQPLLANSVAMLRAGALDYETSALTVYVTKCMAVLADAPVGRKQLKASLANLELLAQDGVEPLVQKHAIIAIERIKWKP